MGKAKKTTTGYGKDCLIINGERLCPKELLTVTSGRRERTVDVFASDVSSISHLINKALLSGDVKMVEHLILACKMAEGVEDSEAIVERRRATKSHSDIELLRTRIVPHLKWLMGSGKATYNFTVQMQKVHGKARGTKIAKGVIAFMSEHYSDLLGACHRTIKANR